MQPKATFQMAVRILGLIVMLYGLESLTEGLLIALGASQPHGATMGYWGGKGIIQLIIGAFMVRGSPDLVDFAFDKQKEDDSASNRKDG